jgi:hypothetical protein
MSLAYGQTQSCSRLNTQLRTLDRNSDFRDWEGNDARLRDLSAQLQDAESAYIRGGCNDAARAGQTLSRQCQVIARQIVRGRADAEQLTQLTQSGNAVAQQREALLQEMSRFGCAAQDDPNAPRTPGSRDGAFEQLFGGYTRDDNYYGDGEIDDSQGFQGLSGYNTVRTMCVRLSDGYFWPISYSTLPDFVNNDVAQCQAQCPNNQVDLYYYNNPGEEVEQMRSLSGQPYSSLPTAFKYRTTFDQSQTCKTSMPATAAAGTTSDTGLATISEQIQTYDISELGFPLPSRDPRGPIAAPQSVAAANVVPLPRRRPGTGNPDVPAAIADGRVVQFGNKRVRIVGPETPYVPTGAKGT